MTRKIRTAAGALAALLGVALAAPTALGYAFDSVSGHAYVEDRDPVHKTVTLRGLTLDVTPSSVLVDQHGKRLQLHELRVPKHIGEAIDPKTADAAYFEAVKQVGGLVLVKLKLVDRLPE